MNFYTKVLSRYATGGGLNLNLKFTISPGGGLTKQQIDEIRAALRDLGLEDELN